MEGLSVSHNHHPHYTSCFMTFQEKHHETILFVRLYKFGGLALDIMLERILSLIPKKENGDFQHGAKKEFAQSIGFKNGNAVTPGGSFERVQF